MPTLLLRLCGPMQSWGTRSRFTERDTELEPSKSGVVGLFCAALGLPRNKPVDIDPYDLAGLRMGVRVDHEGRMANDYHTAGAHTGIMRASGTLSKDAVISNRSYLADADFLVGLYGENRALLEQLDSALRAPHWQVFLGRKSFVPAVPIFIPGGGIREAHLEDALRSEALPPLETRRVDPADRGRRRYVFERDPGATAEIRMDQPVGAAFKDRTFGPRWVETIFGP